MRYLSTLFVAIMLTIGWQHSVLAGTAFVNDTVYADASGTKEKPQKKNAQSSTGDEEPECE